MKPEEKITINGIEVGRMLVDPPKFERTSTSEDGKPVGTLTATIRLKTNRLGIWKLRRIMKAGKLRIWWGMVIARWWPLGARVRVSGSVVTFLNRKRSGTSFSRLRIKRSK